MFANMTNSYTDINLYSTLRFSCNKDTNAEKEKNIKENPLPMPRVNRAFLLNTPPQ